MIIYIDIDYMMMKVKEKLVQKEGEASMLASVNKQVLLRLRDIFQTILFNDFDQTTRSSILYSTTTDIYYQMEVQLTELESIKTKLITERNDVAAVVRRELAKTCLMT